MYTHKKPEPEPIEYIPIFSYYYYFHNLHSLKQNLLVVKIYIIYII